MDFNEYYDRRYHEQVPEGLMSQLSRDEQFALFGNIGPSVRKPGKYDVVLLRDDATSPDFVIGLLQTLFHVSHDEALEHVSELWKHGRVNCGRFTRDVAETKVSEVIYLSRESNFDLKCVMQKAVDVEV